MERAGGAEILCVNETVSYFFIGGSLRCFSTLGHFSNGSYPADFHP